MRILIVHCRYQSHSGEEAVAEADIAGLQARGHDVESVWFENEDLAVVGPLRRFLLAWNNRSTARRLQSKLEAFRPDIIHVHNLFPGASLAPLRVAARHPAPVVQTIHNHRFGCLNGLLLRKGKPCTRCLGKSPWRGVLLGCYRESRLASLAAFHFVSQQYRRSSGRLLVDRYVCLNPFQRELLVQSGIPKEKTRIRANTVADIGLGEFEREGLAYVGRLSQEKGIDDLLTAWQSRPHDATRLHLVGTGPMAGAAAAQVDDGVVVHGFLDAPARDAVLRSVKALVLPTRNFEGGPLVLLEALSAGTPVIVSRIGGIPDLLGEHPFVHYVAPNDPGALAEVIARVAAEPCPRTLQSQARGLYEARFSSETGIGQLESIYEELLDH